jgi:hypothetical protein
LTGKRIRVRAVLPALAAASLAFGCTGGGDHRDEPVAEAGKPASPFPFRPRATIAEIMDGIVDPAADVLWDATAVYITEEGIDDHSPKNDDEWHKVEHAGITLAEATNLLLVPGRRVDAPGAVSEAPGQELNPDDIAKLIEAEPEVWAGFAHALDDVVQEAQQAVERRDVEALTEIGGTLDEVCESCHQHFWYPDQD